MLNLNVDNQLLESDIRLEKKVLKTTKRYLVVEPFATMLNMYAYGVTDF